MRTILDDGNVNRIRRVDKIFIALVVAIAILWVILLTLLF